MRFLKICTRFVFAFIVASTLVSCGRSHSTGPSNEQPSTVLKFKTVLGSAGKSDANAPLSKAASITLSKMVVQLTSSSNDTLNDTITTSTSPAINSSSINPQTISKNYSIKPLRTWKLVAKTIDSENMVIHKDSATSAMLKPADTAAISFSMSSKYTMYEAKFLTIPDSISSAASGTGKDVLKINRLKMIIDSGTVSEIVVDSLVSPSFFTSLTTHTISYDYVTPGSHTVKLYAYGPVNTYSGLLYYGSTSVNVLAGNDNTTPLTLSWVGPTMGTGSISVTIGKVGKVTLNGGLPGTVIP